MVCLFFKLVVTKLIMISIGLVSNLKSALLPMYILYITMKECSLDKFIDQKILVALGKKVMLEIHAADCVAGQ